MSTNPINHESNLVMIFYNKQEDYQQRMSEINKNNQLVLFQDKKHNDYYHVLNVGKIVVVKLLKDLEYLTHNNFNYVICEREDVKKTILPKPVKESITTTADMKLKVMNIAGKLYEEHPEFFLNEFKNTKSVTRLNKRMINDYPDFDKRKFMYRVLSYVTKLEENGDTWKVACIKAANSYKVPESIVISLNQTKISNLKL